MCSKGECKKTPKAATLEQAEWYQLTADKAISRLDAAPDTGLSAAEAASRLQKYGPNVLHEHRGPGPLSILLSQFNDFLVWVLIAAVVVSIFVLGELLDGIAILVIVVLNAVLGFVQEYRAESALAALRELSVLDQHEPRATVMLLNQLAEAGMWDEARTVGARAIFGAIHSAKVHRQYAEALAHAKMLDEAIFELESAILCEPEQEDAVATFLLAARVFDQKGERDKARAAAQKVLELDPENAEAKKLAK
jgi:tetratricopeptide (TPR) repeat protein